MSSISFVVGVRHIELASGTSSSIYPFDGDLWKVEELRYEGLALVGGGFGGLEIPVILGIRCCGSVGEKDRVGEVDLTMKYCSTANSPHDGTYVSSIEGVG